MLTRPIREQQASLATSNAIATNNGQSFGQTDASGSFQSSNISNLAVHKQAFYSIAKCIAALTVINQDEGQAVIKQFINDVKVSNFSRFT